MVKKNPFTTSIQVKNTLQEVSVSLSKSTIKRRLHENKYRGFTTRCKQDQVRLCQKKKKTSKKSRPLLEKHSLDGRNYDQSVPEWREEKSMEKAWNSSWSKAYNIICETRWSSVQAWACMASSGTGLLVFIDDVTEDRSSQINSEVYRDILSAHSVKCSKVGWTALHSTSGQWPKTYSKSNPGVFEGKKVEYSAMAKSISWSQPDWACISLVEDKTKGRKTHKQTITEVSCSKGLAKNHKEGNPISGEVREFQAQGKGFSTKY